MNDIWIGFNKKFKKSFKKAKKQGLDISLLTEITDKLQCGIKLEKKYCDHPLKGKYKGFQECHIQPDWLLIYLKEDDVLTLTLVDTVSHSELLDI